MNVNVAAVVVTYNSSRQIAACIASLAGAVRPVVVDNASSDETCAVVEREHPGTLLIRNQENRGFAAAVNQGVAASDEPLVLLLNPDARLTTPIDALVEACRAPGVGAAAGRLLDERSRPQLGFNVRAFPTAATLAFETLGWNRLWASNPVNRRYRLPAFNADEEQDVEQPAGAFLMVRRDALEAIGHLDEQFHPLWFEDVDLCRRLHDAGYRIRYVPSCAARHQGAHSLESAGLELRRLAWYGNLLRFSKKHFSNRAHSLLVPVVLVGVFGRWLWSLVNAKQDERKAYAKVLRLLVGRRVPESRIAGGGADGSSAIQY